MLVTEERWNKIISNLKFGDTLFAYDDGIISSTRAYKVKFIDAVQWSMLSESDKLWWDTTVEADPDFWNSSTPWIIKCEVIGQDGSFVDVFGLDINGDWFSFGQLITNENGEQYIDYWNENHGLLDLTGEKTKHLCEMCEKTLKLYKRKKKIICVVGPSGSGKTSGTIEVGNRLGVEVICSFTNRPMREGETDGVEHWFCEKRHLKKEDLLAWTEFGGYEYWVPLSFVTKSEENAFLYVIDEDGLRNLRVAHNDKFDIKSIYISRDNEDGIEQSRVDRDKDRNKLPLSSYNILVENNKDLHSFYNAFTVAVVELLCDI